MYGNYGFQQHPSYGFQRNNNMEHHTLQAIAPAVNHGLREAQHLGYQHALKEAVAIGYLIGKGYNFEQAWQLVESWWRPPGSSLPQQY
ncbi:hypothetical protein H9655_18515 [Cytobacillus sp. Sa5YUA1]|uniref:Uncharacterized protein n=1 Tax=Cytobacillus stercorigallinarum TaxID=2762240 RepID=A0ABR8QU22_9BACI|nr:hypothetical protein [Cytobacillus stercorigallinarum]MBD7939035.1 hypothetical protein [Cytobacillus stercorigallinarum]